jgi:hypothetical protein
MPMMRIPLVIAVALAAIVLGGLAAPTDAAPNRDLPLIEFGEGTASPDPCLNREGRCGFVLQGTVSGTPVEGTFFSVIDDDGAASLDRCVRARYAGVFGAGPDESIGHTARGRLCPDGAGGFAFAGRFRITGGFGSFEGLSGRGDLAVELSADGSASN